MKIDKEEHKRVMLNILSDISSDSELALQLGFKGGTCCYFIYGLDRFSVDLDFDLLFSDKKEFCLERIDKILVKYGKLYKHNSLMLRKIKYREEASALKIDISDRPDINKLNVYEIKDVVSGLPLNVLSKADMFAHKLAAIKGRYDNKNKDANKKIANRDLYDVNFFFTSDWRFNRKIIELRTGKSARDYFLDLIDIIEKKVDNKKILDGIGALVDENKRDWVKNNLKQEVIKQLAISAKSME